MVKPADTSGSFGVMKYEAESDIEETYKYALPSYFVYKIYDVCKSDLFRKIGILLDKVDLGI